ncbi:C2 domain-containing protein 3 [Turdus rufiventris]|nr:C2 domain-containing protein 3 [Turdus rufiventris]
MRRRGGAGDPGAAATTSLPPLVQGPPRCFLRCTVPRVRWAAPQPPAVVRLRWWGETAGGTVLQPAGTALHPAGTAGTALHPAGRTWARFAVRCGPRQLAAYLADMGVLVLEVLTKLDHLPLGKAQITELSQLSPSHPIKGSFAVLSPTSDKLGELQVSLVLEPLPELYDTSSSVLTTEGTSGAAAAQGSSKPQLSAPSQQPRHTQVTVEQQAVNNSKATTLRGKDRLLSKENSENMQDTFSAPHPRVILPDEHLKLNPSSQPLSFPTSTDPEALPRRSTGVLSMHNPATKDLLSALLDQGNKLRDAMAVSAMKSSPDMEIKLNKMSHFIERDEFKAPAKSPKGLKSSFVPTPEDPLRFGSEVSGQQFGLNSEERAIQLLLGSADFSPGHFWDQTGSLWDSLSLGSEVYDSELGDPHYDQSLLERLFYTAPKSDSSLSDFLSDDDDVKSSKKASKTETLKKAGPVNPQKDFPALDHNVTETKPSCSPSAPPEEHREMALLTALAADRLALLQQIHLARVIIESLKIPPESIQISPRRKGLQGKPPRPMSVHKCTFFVEYHFPVRVSKDDKGQVSITTEAIRVASSKITDDVVKFQQRSVFPVWFGGAMIEHWWGSDLAFKIYMRKSTQKKVMPFSLTSKHLERLKNNVMIIEAWNKLGSPGCDKLLGLVKLPLHQFYISFKDPRISHLLLQAQYPVVAVDGHVPVVDVFTGSTSGSLRVLLAMGSAEQIVALQRLKAEAGMVPPVTQRPPHSLDPPPPTKPTMQLDPKGEDLVEHVFEIHVEGVKGLTPLQSTVWGEADCYIQYHFPVQEPGCGALQGPGLYEHGINLKHYGFEPLP